MKKKVSTKQRLVGIRLCSMYGTFIICYIVGNVLSIFRNVFQLTIVLSMEGSSSGVKANEDFRWPILPVGKLVPPPEN